MKTPETILEESEEGVDYPPGSDDSEEESVGSNHRLTNGFMNSQDELDGKPESHIGSSTLPRPKKSKYSRSSSRTDSRSSSLHHSSGSSYDFDLSLKGEQRSFPRLKSNSSSPAALNTLFDGQADDSDYSPRLTPTHSNFDDSQLISPSMGISYHPHSRTLRIQNDRMGKSSTTSLAKHGSGRKKKRSGSWYNVLSPSYKQKNEDFHKFFKDLPSTERLLVDYACALVKDILVQGRVYASQNYLCFHSNILKWQTAVTVKLVDIDQMTKEKTVKVIPNAIQILLKDKTKITFTSFTARDRAYLTIFRLWQNALLDKPMSANELWSQIHRNYGEELGGCSSDDDYVRPKLMPKKHQTLTGHDGDLKYEFGTTNKVKRSSSSGTQTLLNGELDKSERSSKSSQDSPMGERQAIEFSDEKSSNDEISLGDDITNMEDEGVMKPETSAKNPVGDEKNNVLPKEPEESDDEPEEYLMQELPKSSFCRIYNISVRDLYRIIFSDDCPFWKETLVNKGTTGITFGTWQNEENSDGQYVRELSYTLRLDNSIGPKTSFVKETQLYYTSSVEGKSYIIDCVAQNYGIPYADYFYTVMRYGIRKVSKTSCELRISWELRYKKSPWGLVKNFIEKNVASGMAENFKKLQHQIQERIDFEKTQPQTSIKKSPEKSSGMRRRKRKSVSQAASTAQTKAKTSESSQKGAGDVHNSSDMNNNKSGSSSSSDVTPGVPPIYPANGFIPNQPHSYNAESPKLHYFGHGSKFIFSAIVFLFVLLLYSNYTMYHRLLVLEQATAAAATAEGVDPSVTAALLDRPGVPITSNPEVLSIYLQAIDKRLRRLEDTVLKFTQNSNRKWEKFEKSFEAMESLLDKAVKKKALKVP